MDQIVQNPEYSSCKYEVKDITDPENKEWWDKYCFDIPVLHVENKVSNDNSVGKLFHRFNEEKVQNLINEFK